MHASTSTQHSKRQSGPNFVEVEVVSPGGKAAPGRASAGFGRSRLDSQSEDLAKDPLFALLAKVLDELFRIPGTNIKIGLDPLIGLVPGMGDSSSAIISTFLIIRGAQAGLPRIVLARMALNVLINAAVGAIPGVGDVFSVFYKSNIKNLELFQKHAGNPNAGKKADWLFVSGLIGLMLIVVGLLITVALTIFGALWQAAWSARA
ncbi:MAG TPA: DUF4112 domain-containing protein [Chthoniobacterales bacterium]